MNNIDECCICLNNNNENSKKCNTCINSICNNCINNINYELNIDEFDETINLTYKCPCCNSINILNENHKSFSKIYKQKTTELIMDLLEMKSSFMFIKSQLKEYEIIFENKYYEINNDVLLTA